MAIIYTYPELKLSDLTKHDLFIITDVSSLSTANSTKSLSLDNLVRYVKQSGGGGTGTANKIPKFKTTGSSVLEDSIMTQNGSFQIDLAGSLSLQPTGAGPSLGSYSIYFRGIDDTGAELNGGRIFTIDSQINPSGQDLYFQNADDNGILKTNLVIDAFGSVGIATTLPNYLLDVNGTGNFTGQLTIPVTPVATNNATSKQYVDNLVARKIFTATSLDTTTNYNVSPAGTQTPIVWDSELIKDSIYTHDNATNPEQVTVTQAGTYRIYSMLTATSTGTRAQVLLKIAINGTSRARFGAQMYIRNGSGQNKSSSTIEETIVLNANDIITITGERGSSTSTAVYNISEASYFSIEKIA